MINVNDTTLTSRTVLETTDATPVVMFSIEPDDNTGGIVQAFVSGFDGTNTIAGGKQAAFKKLAGVVTISSVTDTMATVAPGSEGFTLTADGGLIKITVTGSGAASWFGEYKVLSAYREAAL